MKIVHLSIYPPQGEKHAKSGGVASYTKNLVTNVPYGIDDDVYVLCDKIDGESSVYDEDGVVVKRCFDRNVGYIRQVLREIKDIDPDVIHVQQELGLYGNVITAYMLQWLLFFLRKYTVVITLHGVVSLGAMDDDFIRENNSALPKWLVRWAFKVIYAPLCKYAKKVIVHEEKFKEILVKEYRAQGESIFVVPHGIEVFEKSESAPARKALSIEIDRDAVLFMGYLIGYKGVDLLLEGFAAYAKSNPKALLVIGAGKHPKFLNEVEYLREYARLQAKAKELIPADQYRWVGFIKEKDISLYYSACDVSVYPYTIQMSSSGPMAIAIGHGKAFIASDVFEGVVHDDLLFKRNDAADINKKMGEFFHDKNYFESLIIEELGNKSWRQVANTTYQIYK